MTITIAWHRVRRTLRRAVRKAYDALVWTIAPVATSVRGSLDRTDWRPIAARVVILGSTASAGMKAALRDPDLMAAAAVLLVAVVSGLLAAVERLNLGQNPCPPPPPPTRDLPRHPHDRI